MKVQKASIPTASILSQSEYDYGDSYEGEFLDKDDTIDTREVVRAFFRSSPEWIERLMNFRNRAVSIFGLKTVETKSNSKEEILKRFEGTTGEQVGIFKVFGRTENEIILGEDDKHLDFRVSFLLENTGDSKKKIALSTTVQFHNHFGKLYFLPVKPFHKVIAPTMLKNTIKELTK